jgi:hypothetical protein
MNNTQHNDIVSCAVMLSGIMLSVAFFSCYADCHYAEYCYADCHYAEFFMLSGLGLSLHMLD